MKYHLLSISIHLFFLYFINLSTNKNKAANTDFVLHLIENKKSNVIEKIKGNNLRKSLVLKKVKKNNKRGKLPAHDKFLLQPNIINDIIRASGFKSYNEGGDDLNLADDMNAEWGDGGSQFGRIKDYNKMEKILYHMEGLVEYPAPLSYRGIDGVIRARIVVSEKGHCDWNHTKIFGVRPELRLYILSLLKQICRNELWANLKKRQSSNIDFLFHFDNFSSEKIAPKILGNVLMYHLPGYQQKGEWRLGPIKGNFYFPSFVFLNPQWIIENWNQLIHEEDPMKRFKEMDDINSDY